MIMKYEKLKGLNDTKFKSAVGAKREVFGFQAVILEDTVKENINMVEDYQSWKVQVFYYLHMDI